MKIVGTEQLDKDEVIRELQSKGKFDYKNRNNRLPLSNTRQNKKRKAESLN